LLLFPLVPLSRSTLFPWPTDKPSMPSGRPSPPQAIPDERSSSKVSLPCVAFPKFVLSSSLIPPPLKPLVRFPPRSRPAQLTQHSRSCFLSAQLSLLSEQVHHLIRLDPFDILPREISLKVLSHLDAFSLGKAAQVSSNWKSLADDDLLWRGMCVQHIERKCTKCGWGLPLLERRRLRMEIDGHYEDSAPSSPTLAASSHHHHHHEHPNAPHIKPSRVSQPIASTSTSSSHLPPSISTTPSSSAPSSPRRLAKRPSPPSDDENDSSTSSSSNKRTRSHSARPTPLSASHSLDYDAASSSSSSSSIQPPPPSSCALPPTNAEASCSSSKIIPFASTSRRPAASCRTLTRPWKEVYTERLIIERNWRRGRYAVRTFKGHTDGVMCLQVLEGEEFGSAVGSAACGNRKGKGREKASPGQGIMITGSYDRTARVWDLESGKEVMVSASSFCLTTTSFLEHLVLDLKADLNPILLLPLAGHARSSKRDSSAPV
jgi:F-box/WD-40 domain protein MET30